MKEICILLLVLVLFTCKTKKVSSKYRGVTWDSRENKWKSQIGLEGKVKHLGYFNSEILAARRYDAEALITDDRNRNF